MKKVIEVEKIQEILNMMGDMPIKYGFDVTTKLIQVLHESQDYKEPLAEEIKHVEIIKP